MQNPSTKEYGIVPLTIGGIAAMGMALTDNIIQVPAIMDWVNSSNFTKNHLNNLFDGALYAFNLQNAVGLAFMLKGDASFKPYKQPIIFGIAAVALGAAWETHQMLARNAPYDFIDLGCYAVSVGVAAALNHGGRAFFSQFSPKH